MALEDRRRRQHQNAQAAAELAVKDVLKGRSYWRESVLYAGYQKHLAHELDSTYRIALDAQGEWHDERYGMRESTTMYSQP